MAFAAAWSCCIGVSRARGEVVCSRSSLGAFSIVFCSSASWFEGGGCIGPVHAAPSLGEAGPRLVYTIFGFLRFGV